MADPPCTVVRIESNRRAVQENCRVRHTVTFQPKRVADCFKDQRCGKNFARENEPGFSKIGVKLGKLSSSTVSRPCVNTGIRAGWDVRRQNLGFKACSKIPLGEELPYSVLRRLTKFGWCWPTASCRILSNDRGGERRRSGVEFVPAGRALGKKSLDLHSKCCATVNLTKSK